MPLDSVVLTAALGNDHRAMSQTTAESARRGQFPEYNPHILPWI